MQIDASLNLALTIRSQQIARPDPENADKTIVEDIPLVTAYHTPISKEVFEANHRVIAATNSMIWGKGVKYAATAGARIATLLLLDAAKLDAEEWGTDDVGAALRAELKRLTLILAPGPKGFVKLPVDIAISQNVIDAEEWNEAEAAIVFFTVGYAMALRKGRKNFCEFMASKLGGSITSSSPTDFIASLQTSTQAATTEAAVLSSVPS